MTESDTAKRVVCLLGHVRLIERNYSNSVRALGVNTCFG